MATDKVGGHQATIEKLYVLYMEQGFLCEEEALAVMSADGVSLVGINHVTDKLIALGVIFTDGSPPGEDNDRAQTDYEALYTEVLQISPAQLKLVDYIRNTRPPKTREWQSLITQMNSGNEYAFSRLFEMYLRVVIRIALRFYKENDLELDDAIQEGSMGLMRAIQQYDGSKHDHLGSYLPLWIQQYLNRALADKSRTIRLPVHAFEIVQRLIKSRKELEDSRGDIPSFSEIAVESGISVETTKKLLEAIQEPVSMEALFESDANEEIVLKYLAVPSFEDEVDNNLFAKMVRDVLGMLTEREVIVLSLRYGLEDGCERTLEEVGTEFNVTRERIRQIEAKALKKLRHSSRVQKLIDFI